MLVLLLPPGTGYGGWPDNACDRAGPKAPCLSGGGWGRFRGKAARRVHRGSMAGAGAQAVAAFGHSKPCFRQGTLEVGSTHRPIKSPAATAGSSSRLMTLVSHASWRPGKRWRGRRCRSRITRVNRVHALYRVRLTVRRRITLTAACCSSPPLTLRATTNVTLAASRWPWMPGPLSCPTTTSAITAAPPRLP